VIFFAILTAPENAHKLVVSNLLLVLLSYHIDLHSIGRTMAEAAEEEIARIRDEEEARIAVEKAMRISGSFDEHEDNDDDVNDPLPSEYC